MTAIDNFAWNMRNVDGVQEVMSLPVVAKMAIAGWNEGSLKWRNIPREPTSSRSRRATSKPAPAC